MIPSLLLQTLLATTAGLMIVPPVANTAWSCYLASLSDLPTVADNVICIYDTMGIKQGRSMAGEVYERQGIQIKVRSIDYPTGWSKSEDITKALDGIVASNVTVGGHSYKISSAARLPILPLGSETQSTGRRYFFTINLTLSIIVLS